MTAAVDMITTNQTQSCTNIEREVSVCCHAAAMPLPLCRCHAATMPLRRGCHTAAVSLRAAATLLSCRCHAAA